MNDELVVWHLLSDVFDQLNKRMKVLVVCCGHDHWLFKNILQRKPQVTGPVKQDKKSLIS